MHWKSTHLCRVGAPGSRSPKNQKELGKCRVCEREDRFCQFHQRGCRVGCSVLSFSTKKWVVCEMQENRERKLTTKVSLGAVTFPRVCGWVTLRGLLVVWPWRFQQSRGFDFRAWGLRQAQRAVWTSNASLHCEWNRIICAQIFRNQLGVCLIHRTKEQPTTSVGRSEC